GGGTLGKPESITVASDVEMGMEASGEPFGRSLGKAKSGADCKMGACSIVQDAVLEDEVEVGAFTMVAPSRLERGVHAGPYARLRMDNHVEAGAHIGDFVGLKKTHMGARAKAKHPTYLGDSESGAKRN